MLPKNEKRLDHEAQQIKGVTQMTVEDIKNHIIKKNPDHKPPTEEDYRREAFEFVTQGKIGILRVRGNILKLKNPPLDRYIAECAKELGLPIPNKA
jgi:hypothetical protein